MFMYLDGGRGEGGVDSVVKFSDCRWMLGRNKRGIFLWFISDSLNCFLNEQFSFLSCIGFVILNRKQNELSLRGNSFLRTVLNCFDYERRYAIKSGT